MIHLREIKFSLPRTQRNSYPFNIPVTQSIQKLEFTSPVTIFVGENGSGKSTILESIAAHVGSIAVGSEEIARDDSLAPVAPLVKCMKSVWNKRTHQGFFLRAEDFFGYVRRIRKLRREMEEELSRVDSEYANRSATARSYARMPAVGSIHALDTRYGKDLDANSHGESFLTLFQSRFVPGGLYLLDEPEAALSPLRQLGLISLINTMVGSDAQFILATHSPILMAVPGAVILDFDQQPPQKVDYEELEQIALYRDFLAEPKAFLRHLE